MWNAIVDRQTGFLNFTPELATAMRETVVAVLGAGGNGVVDGYIDIDPRKIGRTARGAPSGARKAILKSTSATGGTTTTGS